MFLDEIPIDCYQAVFQFMWQEEIEKFGRISSFLHDVVNSHRQRLLTVATANTRLREIPRCVQTIVVSGELLPISVTVPANVSRLTTLVLENVVLKSPVIGDRFPVLKSLVLSTHQLSSAVHIQGTFRALTKLETVGARIQPFMEASQFPALRHLSYIDTACNSEFVDRKDIRTMVPPTCPHLTYFRVRGPRLSVLPTSELFPNLKYFDHVVPHSGTAIRMLESLVADGRLEWSSLQYGNPFIGSLGSLVVIEFGGTQTFKVRLNLRYGEV